VRFDYFIGMATAAVVISVTSRKINQTRVRVNQRCFDLERSSLCHSVPVDDVDHIEASALYVPYALALGVRN